MKKLLALALAVACTTAVFADEDAETRSPQVEQEAFTNGAATEVEAASAELVELEATRSPQAPEAPAEGDVRSPQAPEAPAECDA